MTNRQPTHNLCMVAKDESKRGFQTIGVGWVNEKGDISIKLNKGVSIAWRDLEDHAIYLFRKLTK